MVVTFLIGNGFDISLGLKTKYKDFYKYLKSEGYGEKNELIKHMISDKEYELWVDLELGLGKYTSGIDINNKKSVDKFYDDKQEVDVLLRKYLMEEQNRIDWDDNTTIKEIGNKFLNDVTRFPEYLNAVGRDSILSTLGNTYNGHFYKIVSFNYTNILKRAKEKINSAAIEVYYAHGSLENKNTILGVNDITQIENAELAKTEDMPISMCKLARNEFLGQYAQDNAVKSIENQGIVCIFGMSMGATDKFWWNTIGNGLKKGTIKKVVIFYYEHNLDETHLVKVNRIHNDLKKKLLEYTSLEEKEKKALEDRILVSCNSNIFKLKPVLKEQEELTEGLVKEIEEHANVIR